MGTEDLMRTVDVPKGWRAEAQIFLTEPAAAPVASAGPTLARSKAPNPAMITVYTGRSQNAEAEVELAGFLEDLGRQSPGFKTESQGELDFVDGARGHYAIVTYPVDANVKASQLYAVRCDSGWTSRLCVSVEAAAIHRLQTDLFEIAKTLRKTEG